MSTVIKKEKGKRIKGSAVVSSTVTSHANDPYFVNKANEAKHVIEKFGLPGHK